MSTSNRHIPMIVGEHDALAAVNLFCVSHRDSVVRVLSSVVKDDSAGCNLSVFAINFVAYVSKVAQAVVRFITVDVVDFIRLFTVNKKPSKPMNVVPIAINADLTVSAAVSSFATNYFTRVSVVANDITDRIRDNFVSHFKLLLDLVRGSVVGATDSPILPEFALSGGDKRGPSALTEPHPIRRSL